MTCPLPPGLGLHALLQGLTDRGVDVAEASELALPVRRVAGQLHTRGWCDLVPSHAGRWEQASLGDGDQWCPACLAPTGSSGGIAAVSPLADWLFYGRILADTRAAVADAAVPPGADACAARLAVLSQWATQVGGALQACSGLGFARLGAQLDEAVTALRDAARIAAGTWMASPARDRFAARAHAGAVAGAEQDGAWVALARRWATVAEHSGFEAARSTLVPRDHSPGAGGRGEAGMRRRIDAWERGAVARVHRQHVAAGVVPAADGSGPVLVVVDRDRLRDDASATVICALDVLQHRRLGARGTAAVLADPVLAEVLARTGGAVRFVLEASVLDGLGPSGLRRLGEVYLALAATGAAPADAYTGAVASLQQVP